MSEIKGQLLGLVLTIVVFGIVFGALTLAMETSASKVAGRMKDEVDVEYEAGFINQPTRSYTLHY